jgi:cytochrome c2
VGNDPVSVLVSLANPARGQELFNTMYDTNVGPYACATCHNVDSVERKIGPGQLNVAERAATRVEGQSAAQYIYNSVLHPNDYVVEEYTPNLMPGNYRDLLTDQDIYAIIAYMFTLR